MEKFRRALSRFEKALTKFKEGLTLEEELKIPREIAVEVLSKRFEYTYEAMWKAVKEALRERGIECNSPRSCFRELLKEGIVPYSYEEILYKMVELRNTLVHIYSQEQAEEIYGKIRELPFKEAFETTLKGLKNLE